MLTNLSNVGLRTNKPGQLIHIRIMITANNCTTTLDLKHAINAKYKYASYTSTYRQL